MADDSLGHLSPRPVSVIARPIVPVIVEQHVDDARVLCDTRMRLVSAPHIKLHHLRRVDDRLAAHLDGLGIAGEQGWPMVEAALANPSSGAVFVATVRALLEGQPDRLDAYLALAASMPELVDALDAACGWLDAPALRGVVAGFLSSDDPIRRRLGIAASAFHRVDPSLGSARRLDDPDPHVRARAFRAAGELGKREFLSRLGRVDEESDPECRFWTAWAAVLLGDRHQALDLLQTIATAEGGFRAQAALLAWIALPTARAHDQLRALAADPAQLPWLIRGAGLVGDPAYVPWLMKQMTNEAIAQVAGESFSLITGADLAALDLERKPPEQSAAGPNDNPADANVAMDEDESLPWPDVERIERWWARNTSRFPQGQRYFVGATVSREHCIEVLRTGYQRQRILAAHHMCLLEPGALLFEWRAPAWRQARTLAALA